MLSSVTLYSIGFGAIGLMFIGLGLPLIFNRVPPNRWYGFRTRKTLSATKYWYAANRISGKNLVLAGTIQTASALLVLICGQSLSASDTRFLMLAVMISTLAGAIINDFRELNKMP